MNHDAYSSYHTVNLSAQTAQASPVQLVIVLMDGLQDELARARAHIAAKRYELKARSLDKCIDILTGLSSALDLDAGGEVVSWVDTLEFGRFGLPDGRDERGRVERPRGGHGLPLMHFARPGPPRRRHDDQISAGAGKGGEQPRKPDVVAGGQADAATGDGDDHR